MQVLCIKPFGLAKPGDLVEVPDDAAVDPEYWAEVTVDLPAAEPEPDAAPETPPESSSPSAPAAFPSPLTPADPQEM